VAQEWMKNAKADFLQTTLGSNAIIKLPDIPGLVVAVHSLHLHPLDGIANSSYRRYGITHDLNQVVYAGDDVNLWAHWTNKGANNAGSTTGVSPPPVYFQHPYPVVGAQNVVVGPGDNPITVGMLSLYYTIVKVSNVEWLLIRGQTHIGDMGVPQ